jgi:tRNA-N(6)-(isopentenyl)adenosine-37 thiotransferase enzyme MiaB
MSIKTFDEISEYIISQYEFPPLAFVNTFGCQQNVNDSEKIKGELSMLGFGMAPCAEEADFILFNTCAVREHAEQRVFGNIGALKKLKEQNPKLIIGLCGCMVQQQHIVDKIKQSYPYVDIVFGVNAIHLLPELIYQKLSGTKKILLDPVENMDIFEEVQTKRDSSFKAWLPIMYGCDNFCSFCIVPYVRGRERSRKPEAILKEFKQLVADGYKDITLLGQNVNSYGKGLNEEIDFSDLLQMLASEDGDFRIRFMTSHPKDATHKMIDTIAKNNKISNHIHLPVQSGSNRILSLMNRVYSIEQYKGLIEYAKEKISNVTFSSDIIIGFPGETEKDFQKTLSLVKQIGYMQLFTFIFSKRSGTKAAEMRDDTPRKIKTDRLNFLVKEQEIIAEQALQQFIGTVERVLVEEYIDDKKLYTGRLDNNLTIEFPGENIIVGNFLTVTVTGARKAMLKGVIK